MAKPVMVEREEPRFVQFATGEVVEGVLVDVERVEVKGKPCLRYTVKEDEGGFVNFIGTHQINVKLRPDDKGHYVSVRCEGEDVTVKRGENCMKVFKILVSKEKAQDGDLYISDSDFPF